MTLEYTGIETREFGGRTSEGVKFAVRAVEENPARVVTFTGTPGAYSFTELLSTGLYREVKAAPVVPAKVALKD